MLEKSPSLMPGSEFLSAISWCPDFIWGNGGTGVLDKKHQPLVGKSCYPCKLRLEQTMATIRLEPTTSVLT